MRDDLCVLIGLVPDGASVELVEQEIFCGKKSATRSEFYGAYAVGLKPKFILEIDPLDWEMATEKIGSGGVPVKVKYANVEYNILRTFVSDESTMELTVG